MNRILAQVPASLMFGLAFWASGCAGGREGGDQMAASQHVRATSDSTPLKISITPSDRQRRDRIVIEVNAINQGSRSFGWDREWCVFLYWQLKTDKGQKLDSVWVSDVKPTKKALSKSRFLRVNPGQKLTKTFELTKGFREFSHGYACDPNMYFANEHIVRYDIPRTATSLTVRVAYSYVPFLGPPCFELRFGYAPGEVGLPPPGPYESNEIIVPLHD